MKLHYFFKEAVLFFIVFFFFLLPSLLQASSSEQCFSCWSFPYTQFIYMLLSFLILLIESNIQSCKNIFLQKVTVFRIFLNSGYAFFSLGLLFIISILFQILAKVISYDHIQFSIVRPAAFTEWIFCLLTFLIASVFEENIFRLYLPAFFENVFSLWKLEKNLSYLYELPPALLFAFCHRYLGIFAVLNAFSAHFVLRFCYKRIKSPYYNYFIHFIYNFFNLILFTI